MERVGDAFVWPFRDPRWAEKVAVIGLIGLIPIVGGINTFGWLLAALARLRAGDETLPPAGFGYLARGFQLFVVLLVYYLVVIVIAAALYLPAIVVLNAQSGSSGNGLLAAVGVGLILLAFAVTIVGSLAMIFIRPSIVLAVDHGGMGGGFDVAAVLKRVAANPVNTLIAGLMLFAATFIGGLGFYVCVVGLIFTYPYSVAMEAWVVRSYELGSKSEEGLNVGKPTAPAR